MVDRRCFERYVLNSTQVSGQISVAPKQSQIEETGRIVGKSGPVRCSLTSKMLRWTARRSQLSRMILDLVDWDLMESNLLMVLTRDPDPA